MSALDDLLDRPPWFELARCRGLDPSLFHPERGESSAEAKAICAECPVRAECLGFALTNNEKFGIWGGAFRAGTTPDAPPDPRSGPPAARPMRHRRGMAGRLPVRVLRMRPPGPPGREERAGECRHGCRQIGWLGSRLRDGLVVAAPQGGGGRVNAPLVTIHMPSAKASLVAGILALLPSYVTLEVRDGNLVVVDPGRAEAGRTAIDSLRAAEVNGSEPQAMIRDSRIMNHESRTLGGNGSQAEPGGGEVASPQAPTLQSPPVEPGRQAGGRPWESMPTDFTARSLDEQRAAPHGSLILCEQCNTPFVKKRFDQRFHDTACGRKWHGAHWRGGKGTSDPVVLAVGPTYECGPCGLEFPYAARLDHHNRQFHQPEAETAAETAECPQCGRDEFPEGWDLAKHVQLMHPADPPKVGESRSDYEARLRSIGLQAES